MKTNKNTNKSRAQLPEATGDTRSTSAIERKVFRRVVKADAQVPVGPTPEDVTKHIERQTLRAFLDAVNIWRLNDADSARLVGVEPASVEVWKSYKAKIAEDVLAPHGHGGVDQNGARYHFLVIAFERMDDIAKQRLSVFGPIAIGLRRGARMAWPILGAASGSGVRCW